MKFVNIIILSLCCFAASAQNAPLRIENAVHNNGDSTQQMQITIGDTSSVDTFYVRSFTEEFTIPNYAYITNGDNFHMRVDTPTSPPPVNIAAGYPIFYHSQNKFNLTIQFNPPLQIPPMGSVTVSTFYIILPYHLTWLGDAIFYPDYPLCSILWRHHINDPNRLLRSFEKFTVAP
jgi:hypothetical protein